MIRTCPTPNKDDWCLSRCPHAKEHEENEMCTNGRCPITYCFCECVPKDGPSHISQDGQKTGSGDTCTLTDAVIKITENCKEALHRDNSHLVGCKDADAILGEPETT